ncbi:MAG: hypothetical protein JW976_10905 [Syntrophaceae bacterium]|nr:hypothetical protein [Syntrophaceae bacterium]
MDAVFEKVDSYYIEINNRLDSANRNEIAVYHVYGADGLIKGNGLPVFWDSLGKQYSDYLASYDITGLKELGEIIQSSIWVKNVVERGISDDGYFKFTEDEEKELSIIESQYYKASENITSALWSFISTIE